MEHNDLFSSPNNVANGA